MNQIKTIILGGMSAYVATFALLSHSVEAAAKSRIQHSATCHYYNDAAGSGLYNGQSLRNNTSSGIGIYCPVDSDSYLAHRNADFVRVNYKGSSSTAGYSRACELLVNADAATCGTIREWSSGWNSADLNVSEWTTTYGNPYLYHYLSPGDRINGFYIAAP
ncbi:MAG: hypothetical protein JW940_29665 [Polyangiaceae bacterium]|nr:hypothetical protein [Polyangiaceae bacterium]